MDGFGGGMHGGFGGGAGGIDPEMLFHMMGGMNGGGQRGGGGFGGGHGFQQGGFNFQWLDSEEDRYENEDTKPVRSGSDIIDARISLLRKAGFALLAAAVFVPFDLLAIIAVALMALFICISGVKRWFP